MSYMYNTSSKDFGIPFIGQCYRAILYKWAFYLFSLNANFLTLPGL